MTPRNRRGPVDAHGYRVVAQTYARDENRSEHRRNTAAFNCSEAVAQAAPGRAQKQTCQPKA